MSRLAALRCALVCTGLLLAGLLAACTTSNDTLDGVALASPAFVPSLTPVPTLTPTLSPDLIPRPGYMVFNYLDVDVRFHYPQAWQAFRSGWYAGVYAEMGESHWPRLGVMILGREGETLDAVAGRDYYLRYNAEEQTWLLSAGSVLSWFALPVRDSDRATSFAWDGQTAALRTFDVQVSEGRAGRRTMTRTQLTLQLAAGDRYVLIWASAPRAGWETFEADVLAVLESLTIKGEALPIAQIQGAIASLRVAA